MININDEGNVCLIRNEENADHKGCASHVPFHLLVFVVMPLSYHVHKADATPKVAN